MGRLISRVADFFRESDKIMLFVCFFAACFGSIAVCSATRHTESLRPFIVQCIGTFGGVGAAIVISLFDYKKFVKLWYLAAGVGVIPVILTFFIGIAPENTDDKAWLDLGFTTFQPSELMKICFMITFAAHLSAVGSGRINKLKYLIPVCIHGAFPVILILVQGDAGTALVFAVMVLVMMWAAGVSWKYFVAAFVAAVLASPLVYFFVMNDDQRARIVSLFDGEMDIQGIDYQQYRGLVTLSNGGFKGEGLFKGPHTQSGYVPESHNDFIFVSIGEELGFLGCMLVVVLLAVICLRAIRVARICTKDSGKFICVGFFGMVFAQTVINLGMCLSVLPVIGVTLPFFSAGGTSLMCLFFGVGVVLSVYMHRDDRTIYLHD